MEQQVIGDTFLKSFLFMFRLRHRTKLFDLLPAGGFEGLGAIGALIGASFTEFLLGCGPNSILLGVIGAPGVLGALGVAQLAIHTALPGETLRDIGVEIPKTGIKGTKHMLQMSHGANSIVQFSRPAVRWQTKVAIRDGNLISLGESRMDKVSTVLTSEPAWDSGLHKNMLWFGRTKGCAITCKDVWRFNVRNVVNAILTFIFSCVASWIIFSLQAHFAKFNVEDLAPLAFADFVSKALVITLCYLRFIIQSWTFSASSESVYCGDCTIGVFKAYDQSNGAFSICQSLFMCQKTYGSIQGLANPCIKNRRPAVYYSFKFMRQTLNIFILLCGLANAFAYTMHIGYLSKLLTTWKQYIIFASIEALLLLIKFGFTRYWKHFERERSGTHLTFWVMPDNTTKEKGVWMTKRSLEEGALQIRNGQWVVRLANIDVDIIEHCGLLTWDQKDAIVNFPWSVIGPEFYESTENAATICFQRCVHGFSSRLVTPKCPHWQIARDKNDDSLMIGISAAEGEKRSVICSKCKINSVILKDSKEKVFTYTLDTHNMRKASRENASTWTMTTALQSIFYEPIWLRIPSASRSTGEIDLYLPGENYERVLSARIDKESTQYLQSIRRCTPLTFNSATN